MVRRQLAARHRWIGRHLQVAHGVHAGEQGPRAQRGVGNGRTTADWTATLTWLSLAFFYASIAVSVVRHALAGIVVGWTNRILITTFVLWLLVAAFHVRSRSG